MTVLQLIEGALNEAGVIAEGDPLPDDMTARALAHFQMMVDRFNGDGLMLYTVGRAPFTLTAGQQTRTMGTGGDFNADRPLSIAHVGVIPVGQTHELEVVPYRTREEWLAEPWKAQTDAYPHRYLWEPTYPLGTFTFWPIPTTAAQVAVSAPTRLTTPASLNTAITFPEGYHEAYHLNLTVRLWRLFRKGTPVSQELRADARDALGVVKRLNDPGPPPARTDGGMNGAGRWDIISGRYLR